MKSQAIYIFVTLALLFGGCGISCFASDNETAGTYSAAPEQIVCTPNGDLQTQVGLAWVTDSSTAGTYVRAVEKTGDEEPDFDGAVLIEGENGVNGTFRWHQVLDDGLEPRTT